MPVGNNVVLWPGWETVRLIGRGSFGAVYEIQRKLFEDDEEVEKAALKVISIPQNDSDIEEMYNDGYDEESVTSSFRSHLKSIVAEYSLMRKMNGSANIVNCDDVRYEQHKDGIGWDIYIKMELLTPLAKSLPATVSDAQVITIAKDMCEALALCDKHNIVHRDIKPQNIFASPNGDYKLGDFGIAKTVEKTMGGTKTGTYKYMAPEVYNNKPYNSTADIYSLGLVLYWLLNERRMPFMPLSPAKLSAGMDEESRQRRFAGEKVPAPKNGSDALKKIVLKACAFDPKDRYQSAKEMREGLQRLSGSAVSTPVAKPKQNSLAAQDTELPEEATVGPVFARNVPPVAEDQDKTVGPVFTPKKTEPAVEEKTVGPQFAQKQTPAPQAAPTPKPIRKKKLGIIAAAVATIGLCIALIPKGTDAPAETTPPVMHEPVITQLNTIPATVPATTQETVPESIQTTAPTEETVQKPQYTLMRDRIKNYESSLWPADPVFGSKYQRKQITSITFLTSKEKAPADSWDVSQNRDGTVLAWVNRNGELYDLYIGAEGGIIAPEDCSYLFTGYINLSRIDFNKAFDTSRVTTMGRMFYDCKNLRELDVSGFDTSSVTDMCWMFYNCSSLTELDLSGFDTANVTSMGGMFNACSGLTELDVSGFDTAKVTDIRWMFFGCSKLSSLDVSHFDVSQVESFENFMDHGRTINGRPWEKFFRK